jgi:hypothetical protein
MVDGLPYAADGQFHAQAADFRPLILHWSRKKKSR